MTGGHAAYRDANVAPLCQTHQIMRRRVLRAACCSSIVTAHSVLELARAHIHVLSELEHAGRLHIGICKAAMQAVLPNIITYMQSAMQLVIHVMLATLLTNVPHSCTCTGHAGASVSTTHQHHACCDEIELLIGQWLLLDGLKDVFQRPDRYCALSLLVCAFESLHDSTRWHG